MTDWLNQPLTGWLYIKLLIYLGVGRLLLTPAWFVLRDWWKTVSQ